MGLPRVEYLHTILRYLQDEWRDKKRGQPEWEWSQWTLIEGDRSTPQQTNGCDCGVFMLCTMDLISQGLQVRFDQQQLTDAHFRERIGWAILHSTLAF